MDSPPEPQRGALWLLVPVATLVVLLVVGTLVVGLTTHGGPSPAVHRTPKHSVEIILGPARAPITVPDAVGLTQAQACQTLTATDLTCSPITAASSAVGVGRVLAQTPVSGSFVEPMTTVIITVSSGPQP